MAPPRASTSLTRWPLPIPPTEGLQDICPSVSMLCVINNVLRPIRELASAASVPAWPPPTTITSNLSCKVMILSGFDIHWPTCRWRTEEFYVINGCNDSSLSSTWNNHGRRRLDGGSGSVRLKIVGISNTTYCLLSLLALKLDL